MATAPTPATREPEPFQPVAAVLAVLFPGAGHAYLGYTRRAVLIAAGVLGLFAGGLLIGGIDAVDSAEDRIWFLAQALVGPVAFGTDRAHQSLFKAYDPTVEIRTGQAPASRLAKAPPRSAYPGEMRVVERFTIIDDNNKPIDQRSLPIFRPAATGAREPNVKSVGRSNELGTLFCAIAGMMNLICVFDAAAKRRAPAGEALR